MRDPNRFVFIVRDYDNDIVCYCNSLEGARDWILNVNEDLVCVRVIVNHEGLQAATYYEPIDDVDDTDIDTYEDEGAERYSIEETKVGP